MSSRAAIWIAFVASLQLAVTASAQPAAAETPTATPAPAQTPTETPAPTQAAAARPDGAAATSSVAPPNVLPSTKSLRGFDLLVMAAYGKSTDQAYGLDVEPYGATFGLDGGYTWAIGLRLGASINYGLGRSLHQERTPPIGRTSELTTEATSLNSALSIGHDLWLRFLILRYSWTFGVAWMNWDFVSNPARSFRGYPSSKGSTAGFYAAPGLAVLWPLGRFTCGLGFDYVIQTNNQIPSGILSKVVVGVKL